MTENNEDTYPSKTLGIERIYDINRIPKDLFECSVGEFDESGAIDRLYSFGDELLSNPGIIMLGFMDESGQVQGILWLEIDAIDSVLNGRYIAVRPEYRDRNVIWITTKAMTEVAQSLGLKYIMGATDRFSKNWENAGWQIARSQLIYQQINQEQ